MLGLIVFENQLKTQTKPVIDVLNTANIRPIMVTGDDDDDDCGDYVVSKIVSL